MAPVQNSRVQIAAKDMAGLEKRVERAVFGYLGLKISMTTWRLRCAQFERGDTFAGRKLSSCASKPRSFVGDRSADWSQGKTEVGRTWHSILQESRLPFGILCCTCELIAIMAAFDRSGISGHERMPVEESQVANP